MTDPIEEAFREGYEAGYNNGQNDQARFDLGGGSNRYTKEDKDSAWDDFVEEQHEKREQIHGK